MADGQSKPKLLLKMTFLGESGVGKTALLHRYAIGTFIEEHKATIGADFLTKELIVDSRFVILQIWDKTKTMSIVASDKTQTPGHKLRHEIINHDGKLHNNFIDVYGRCGKGFGGIENKIDGLKDYQFSIAIENVAEQNWFTEKLLDCFLTGTIPVYYGCPNLGQFGFDTEGVVRIESKVGFDQIKDDINSDLYKKAADSGAIEHNFKKAHEYMDLGSRVIDEVNKFIKKK